jgi:hypothetical protein
VRGILVEKISSIRYFEILKLFIILMTVQIGLFLLAPVWLAKVVIYFLIASIPISALVAYYVYLKTKHIEFSYDDEEFTMRRGKSVLTHKWKEFSKVLLVKVRGHEFLIRLCFTEGGAFDLAASKLGLNPFSFRVKVLKLVQGGA